MRHGLALVALLLPLSGCVVPPDGGYGYPGYPQPGYPVAGYPGGDFAYQGFGYYDGSPTLLVEGATLPLIFYNGGWGYWGSDHGWHRAPYGVERHLNQRFPGGAGFRPWAGGQVGRPEGFRPGGYPAGNPWVGRPAGPAPGGGWAGHPGGPPPGRPAGPPPGNIFQPHGGAPPVRVAAPPAGRPAGPPPERHRQDDHR